MNTFFYIVLTKPTASNPGPDAAQGCQLCWTPAVGAGIAAIVGGNVLFAPTSSVSNGAVTLNPLSTHPNSYVPSQLLCLGSPSHARRCPAVQRRSPGPQPQVS